MEKLKFIGFHATSKDNIDKINKDGFIVNKKRNNEWLGYGIYVFLYKADADSWARGTYYCKNNPVIIKCSLEVQEDKYLDLDNPEEKNAYEIYYKEVLNFMLENGKSMKFKSRHEAMCWGLNIYKKKNQIDLIHVPRIPPPLNYLARINESEGGGMNRFMSVYNTLERV